MTKVGTNGGIENPNVAVCKLIVDETLTQMLKPGMTAEALFDQYSMHGDDFDMFAMLGDDPVIPAHRFSARDYAKERCAVLTQAQPADLAYTADLAHQIATAPIYLFPEIDAPPIAP